MKITLEIDDIKLAKMISNLTKLLNVQVENKPKNEIISKMPLILKDETKKGFVPPREPLYMKCGKMAEDGKSRQDIMKTLNMGNARFNNALTYYLSKFPESTVKISDYVRIKKKRKKKNQPKADNPIAKLPQLEKKTYLKENDYRKIFDESGELKIKTKKV